MTIEHAHSTNGRVAQGDPYPDTPADAEAPSSAPRSVRLRRFVAPAVLAIAAFFVLRRIATRPDLG